MNYYTHILLEDRHRAIRNVVPLSLTEQQQQVVRATGTDVPVRNHRTSSSVNLTVGP